MSDDVKFRRLARRGLLLAFVVAMPLLLLALVLLLSGNDGERILVEVPVGTGARIEAGEQIEIVPRVLEVSVGDVLEIRNLDDVAHQVGPYWVDAGQTLRQTFIVPGDIEGYCSLHPDGAVTIVVR